MQNGKRSTFKVLFLAVSIALVAGCDIGAAPRDTDKEAAGIRPPNSRIQVDAARNRVWFLTEQGVFLYDGSRPERIAFDLPGWTWAGPPYGCLPDLTLGPKGEAVVTSDIVPTLWRIDPATLAVSVHPLALDADAGKDVGFTGLVYSPSQGVYLAASYHHGTLWSIDPLLQAARKLPLSAPIEGACGLALQSRGSQQAVSRMADLCVRAPHGGGWSILLAPDWRSAYVAKQPCAPRAAGEA